VTSRANRWKLGLFVVSTVVVLMGGLTWLGYARLQKNYHEVHAFFDEAVSGLVVGAPVKFRGVPLGTVRKITVAPDRKMIHVTAALYDEDITALGLDVETLEEGRPLPPGLRAQLVQSALTGTAFIQVDYFPVDEGPLQLPFPCPANTVRTQPSTFKSLEEGARDLVRVLPQLAEQANNLLAELRKQIAEAALPELAHSLRGVADDVRTITQRIESTGLVGEAASALQHSRQLVDDLRADAGPIQSVARDLRAVLQRADGVLSEVHVAESGTSLRTASQGIADLSVEMTAMAREVRGELVNLRRALHAIEQLALSLERDPGALLRGRGTAPSLLEDKK
jgi:ABC-type transporter Mla subunit MlaD